MPRIVLDSRGAGRALGGPLGVLCASVAFIVAVTPSVAWGSRRAATRPCGQVQTRVPHTGSLKVFSVDQVSARRVSCAAARGFVRHWEHLASVGELPNRAGGRTRRSVIVFNRWARPYRVGAFVCRSMATPGPGPVLPELVTCGSPAGLVTWRESGRFG